MHDPAHHGPLEEGGGGTWVAQVPRLGEQRVEGLLGGADGRLGRKVPHHERERPFDVHHPDHPRAPEEHRGAEKPGAVTDLRLRSRVSREDLLDLGLGARAHREG